MTKIKLPNGSEIEVTDNVGEVIIAFADEDRREVERNRKRKDKSLDYLQSLGVEIADERSDFVAEMEAKETAEARFKELMNAISQLWDSQKELVDKVYFQGVTVAEIAAQEGVSESAVYARLQTIHKKLKKLLEKSLNF